MIFSLCCFVAMVSWFLSKHHYEKKWGEDIVKRTEAMCFPLFGQDRAKGGNLIHADQECVPRLRSLAPSLTELIQARHRRPANVLRPAAIRWRVSPAKFDRIEFIADRRSEHRSVSP